MTDQTTTPAEDRALFEHVHSLRKVKLTLNEDQVWVLYRLLVAEQHDGSPTLLPPLSRELDHAMGMTLAQLSDAYIGLNTPEEGKV